MITGDALPTTSELAPRVLVFDDNPAIAAQIEQDLIEAGFDVCSTAKISEVLEIAEDFRPDVGVFDIKIDVASSGPRDGIIAFAKVKTLLPFVEGIFVTAFSDVPEYVARAERYGATILPKPYDRLKLTENISTKFKVSRERRLDEWLKLAAQAEQKGVNPNQILDLITDIVSNYSLRYQAGGTDMVDADGVAAALAITDLVARNRDLLPSLIGLFGKEVQDLSQLMRAEGQREVWELAGKYEDGSAEISRELRKIAEDENGEQ